MAPIKLGILGAGIMGERLLRAAFEHAADSVTVSGVWDPAEAAMGRIATALPTVPRAESAAQVIAGCDCVYIASPPATHKKSSWRLPGRLRSDGYSSFRRPPSRATQAASSSSIATPRSQQKSCSSPEAPLRPRPMRSCGVWRIHGSTSRSTRPICERW